MEFLRNKNSYSRVLTMDGKELEKVVIFDSEKQIILFEHSAYDFIKPAYTKNDGTISYGGYDRDIEKIVINDLQKKNKIDLSMKKCFYVSNRNYFKEIVYTLYIPSKLVNFEQIEDCLFCSSTEEEKSYQKQFKIKSANGIEFYHCNDEVKCIPRDLTRVEAEELTKEHKAYYHSNIEYITILQPLKLVEDGLCVSTVYKTIKTENRIKEEKEAEAISKILNGCYVSIDSLKKIKELLKD